MNKVTDVVLVVVIVLLCLYDLAIVSSVGAEATISRRVLYWTLQYPLIAFATGMLIGHLFCPQVIRIDR